MAVRRVAAVTGALTLLAMMTAPGAGIQAATPSGTVFFPNPVQQLGQQSLTDNKDADSAAFAAAYRRVPLTHLDDSGTLVRRLRHGQEHTPARRLAWSAARSRTGTATPTSSSR